MDIKDKRIVGELLQNSRIPLTQLSKKVQLSREVTTYRLAKLEKHIIKQYSTQPNLDILGFRRTGCYIILQNATTQIEKTFIEFLIRHDFIAAISTNIGKYDIIFDIFYKNDKQLQTIIIEIEQAFGVNLRELFVLNFPASHRIFYNKLLGTRRKAIKKQSPSKSVVLDEIDKTILRTLNKNSREKIVSIASSVKLNANAVGYRIKELEKNNIILYSTVFLRFEALDYDIYNIQLKVNSNKDHKKILSFLDEHPVVFYYYNYFGNKDWDIDVGVFIKEKRDLKLIIRELKEFFGQIIDFKEIYLIEKIFKEELPLGVFEHPH